MAGFEHRWEPPGDERSPVLLALHGTGGSEHDLVGVAQALLPGAGVLAPRGQVLEGDGIPRFFTRIPTGQPGAYPFTFDPDEVAARADELLGFVAEHLEEKGLSDRMLAVTGFSNGANMAAALLMLHPGVVRAATLFAPMPVLDEPPRHDLAHTAVWLAGGRQDPIATPEQVERLAGQLAERGAAVDVYFHEGGHEVTVEAVRAGAQWMTKVQAATGGADLP